MRVGRRSILGNWDEVAQRCVTSRLLGQLDSGLANGIYSICGSILTWDKYLELPVASGAVHGDECGEYAHKEENQHHVLGEPDVLGRHHRSTCAV